MGMFFVRSKVGSLGESLGCRYLRDKGYKIVETNYCNTTGRRLGEIDIVAKKSGKIIFVEVKTRVSDETGNKILPEAAITSDKLHKLERIAAYYLRERKQLSMPYAFDALSIVYDSVSKKADIRHLESIFL